MHLSDIPHFVMFNHTQNIAHFTIHKVSLQTLKVTRHHKFALSASCILRLNMYRKPHHKFLQNFPMVDVSQVAMCVSSQISEKVTGEGSFAKDFAMSSDSQNSIKKIKINLLDQMEAINPLKPLTYKINIFKHETKKGKYSKIILKENLKIDDKK